VARRLPAKSAGNVVLEEMRDVGLEGSTRIIEEIRPRRRRHQGRQRQHGDRTCQVKKPVRLRSQRHLSRFSGVAALQTAPESRHSRSECTINPKRPNQQKMISGQKRPSPTGMFRSLMACLFAREWAPEGFCHISCHLWRSALVCSADHAISMMPIAIRAWLKPEAPGEQTQQPNAERRISGDLGIL
jgi:hypothetical protein